MDICIGCLGGMFNCVVGICSETVSLMPTVILMRICVAAATSLLTVSSHLEFVYYPLNADVPR